jgi:hypothetical protein
LNTLSLPEELIEYDFLKVIHRFPFEGNTVEEGSWGWSSTFLDKFTGQLTTKVKLFTGVTELLEKSGEVLSGVGLEKNIIYTYK